MKTVILCGGKGTRLSEYTEQIPKPMLMIGDKPILRHIMDIYIQQGLHEFILPMGYKQEKIREYFMSLPGESRGYSTGTFSFHCDDFSVVLVDTGYDTQTGGRLKRLSSYLTEPFMMTYGDGLANINFDRYEFLADTVITAVNPPSRFGTVDIFDNNVINTFSEKPPKGGFINGGFMKLPPRMLNYIVDDRTNLEKDVLPRFVLEHVALAAKHEGFWFCIDTKRDLDEINRIYEQEGPVWLNFV